MQEHAYTNIERAIECVYDHTNLSGKETARGFSAALKNGIWTSGGGKVTVTYGEGRWVIFHPDRKE